MEKQEPSSRRIERAAGRANLLLEWESIGNDLSVKLTGGASHVGAVGVGIFDSTSGRASSSVVTVPGHREDGLALQGARELSEASRSTTVFIAGIHVDDITKREIEEIVSVAEGMIEELSGILREG
ncbi:hypothetical protein [Methanolobus chelungpuianus]|uniref:Prenylated flavin chaperone LpdD-like domain-containing protein n=1 Tax=Methanolobus chelungpuianus TaxID=502115 RepID=A0AAE3KY44_9EURY|nr:hypothetical protein [Methanolobus chelungpuianus]MCQ6962614.1 hypothetical protein [Methanolobus chelungpuianus]